MSTSYTRNYKLPQADVREILRYAGERGNGEALMPIVNELVAVADGIVAPRVCYREFSIKLGEREVDLGFARVQSRTLCEHLAGCSSVIVFAATVGSMLDRMIARLGVTSPAKQLLMQAVGTERVECLCDVFCQDMAHEYAQLGASLCSRFSPGYGDLPLSLQREIITELSAPRAIGVSLNESLIMSPSKSVSAIIGVRTVAQANEKA